MNFLKFFYIREKWVSTWSELELLRKACKGKGDWPAPPPLSPPPPLLPPLPLPNGSHPCPGNGRVTGHSPYPLQAFRNSSNSLHFETHFSLSITAETPHEPQILSTSSNGRKQKWEQFLTGTKKIEKCFSYCSAYHWMIDRIVFPQVTLGRISRWQRRRLVPLQRQGWNAWRNEILYQRLGQWHRRRGVIVDQVHIRDYGLFINNFIYTN